MKNLFLPLVILSANVFPSGETYKCDQKIIETIKEAWGGNIPNNIIKTAVANGKEVVVGTTAGYFPDDTKCIYSIFHTDSFSVTRIPEQGSPIIKESAMEEIEGGTYEPDAKIKRYHVYTKDGVTAFYKCADCGESGDPEGLVKVSAAKFDAASVTKAKEVMEGLGIHITKDYPSQCP